MMKKRIVSSVSMLLLATPFCYANGYTLSDANHIIVILVFIVVVYRGSAHRDGSLQYTL